MAKFSENAGDYDSVQWTGSNQAEVIALVAQYRGSGWQWAVRPDGALDGVNGLDRLVIPANHWFVAGPMWGDENPNDVPFKVVSATAHGKRFTRKPNPNGNGN